GEGVNLGPIAIPTDRSMRLLVNYRGPRGTFPTYSFVDLIQGRVPPAAINGRIVLLGASFIGVSDANASPFGSTQLPGTERMANIIDMILHRDFISERPLLWAVVATAAVIVLAALTGLSTAVLPTRIAVLAGIVPIVGWLGATQIAFNN